MKEEPSLLNDAEYNSMRAQMLTKWIFLEILSMFELNNDRKMACHLLWFQNIDFEMT